MPVSRVHALKKVLIHLIFHFISNTLHSANMRNSREYFQKYSKTHPALLQDCSMLQQDTKPLHHPKNILFPRLCNALAWVSTRHYNYNKIYNSVWNSDFRVNQVHSRPQERSCLRVGEKILGRLRNIKLKTFVDGHTISMLESGMLKKGTSRWLPCSQH